MICGPLYAPLGHFSGAGPTETELNYAADTLRAAAEYGAAAGIKLVIEPLNRFETYLVNTTEQGRAFTRRVGHRYLGYMYDSFHANIEERSPVRVFEASASEFAHIHISENDRGIPVGGNAALAPVISAARRSGYDGWAHGRGVWTRRAGIGSRDAVWRDLFPDLETLFAESLAFIRRHWDAGG